MTPPAAGAAGVRARAAAPAPLRLPAAPRRVSGPARHPRATERPAARASIFLRLIDHPWLERLVRGRAWIAIVATALLGIVAMQVALLRLGAQVANETANVNAMSARNQATGDTIAALEANRQVGSEASTLGMVYPAASAVIFLQVNPGDARRAADTMVAPSAAAVAAGSVPTHTASTTAPTTAIGSTATVSATTGATGGAGVGGAAAGAGTPTPAGSSAAANTAGDGAAGTQTTTGAGPTTTTNGTQAGTGVAGNTPATTTNQNGASGASTTPPPAATSSTTAAGGTTMGTSTGGASPPSTGASGTG